MNKPSHKAGEAAILQVGQSLPGSTRRLRIEVKMCRNLAETMQSWHRHMRHHYAHKLALAADKLSRGFWVISHHHAYSPTVGQRLKGHGKLIIEAPETQTAVANLL